MKVTTLSCLLGLGLCSILLLSRCEKQGDAMIIVGTCRDQDNNPVASRVTIVVDGQKKEWRAGKECHFPIQMSDATKNITIDAVAEKYLANFEKSLTLAKGLSKTMELSFYRPYSIHVNVVDEANQGISGISVTATGVGMFQTDNRGGATIYIEDPKIKSGSDITIVVEQPDLTPSSPQTIQLLANQYEYGLDFVYKKTSTAVQPPVQSTVSTGSGTTEGAGPAVATTAPVINAFSVQFTTYDAANHRPLPDVQIKLDGVPLGATNANGILRKTLPGRFKAEAAYPVLLEKNQYVVKESNPTFLRFCADRANYSLVAYLELRHELLFSITPADADVTLTGVQNGQRYSSKDLSSTAPLKFLVAPDFYRWQAEKAGFETKVSTSAVDMLTRTQFTVTAALTAIGPSGSVLTQGMSAGQQGQWEMAINRFLQVPVPGPGADDQSKKEYVLAQNSLGNIYREQESVRDLDKSIAAYKKALQVTDYDYSLHLNLALAYYDNSQPELALRSIDNVRRFQSRMPPDQVQSIMAKANYVAGMSMYARYENETDETRKRGLAIQSEQALTTFIQRAPNGFEQEISKAKEITGLLYQEITK